MRIRLTFSKTEDMRYTGHLDLHRTWERTLRRAGLPLAYSQGFHPQPRISLAAALPLGFTSEGEVADIWLEQDLPAEELEKTLGPALPPGLKIIEIKEVERSAPSLQSQVVASEYEVTLLDANADLDHRLEEILGEKSILRERRGKQYDLRPLIESLQRLPDDENGRPRLRMRLSARAGATGRPEELLEALAIPPEAARVHRVRLYFHGQM